CATLMVVSGGCGKGSGNRLQDLGADANPLSDFAKTWRSQVNTRSELSESVIELGADWDPMMVSECHGPGEPLVDLEWVDVAAPARLDVTLDYDGFHRQRFATAYPIAPQTRFLLPTNSAYFQDEEALLRIGPSAFPLLFDFFSVDLDSAQGMKRN